MSSAEQFIYTEELYRLPKRVIVVLPVEWKMLPEDHTTLLRKILNSVRLSLESVQIICQKEITLASLEVFKPTVIISFGSPITPSIALYQAEMIQGVTLIQSDTLSDLDDARKKNLWLALKTLVKA